MLRDAELFVKAEQMVVEVLGRIREPDRELVLPPLLEAPGDDQAAPIWQVVQRYARDEARVPDVLAGQTMDAVGPQRHDGDLLGEDPQGTISRLSGAACAAAREVSEPDAPVQTSVGEMSAQDYLRRLTIIRCFLAQEVAMILGSRACPLPEDLARALWELTEPEASTWRSRGVFREPRPTPDDASWRDRFLQLTGRDPHPFHP